MAKLPLPPDVLPPLRDADLQILPRGRLLWRLYRSSGAHPALWDSFRSYGPTATGRFDHHEPPAHVDSVRAIAHAALDIRGALAEAFQDTRTIDRYRDEPFLVGFGLADDLVALGLAGSWPTRAGASQAITSGRRDIARAWSRAIYASYDQVRGLLYPSSMAGGSTNLAIYERGRHSVPRQPTVHLPLTHPGLRLPVQRVAAELGYAIR